MRRSAARRASFGRVPVSMLTVNLNAHDSIPFIGITQRSLSQPMSVQNSSDQSQSPGTLQFKASFSTSTVPVKRKNSSHLVTPALADDELPQLLRKSFSVDSFAPYQGCGSTRGKSVPRNDSSRGPLAASGTKAGQVQATGRLRGESLSSGSSRILDADGDRYDPLSASATERYRRGQLKTVAKQPIRGGDLPLPLRTPTNSVSTIASTSSTLLNATANMPRNPSSRQSSDRPASGRSRSDSTGINPSRKITINTQVPPSNPVSNRFSSIYFLFTAT